MDELARMKTPDEIRQTIVDRMAILTMRESLARSRYHAELEGIQQERAMLEREWQQTYEAEGVRE